MKSLRACLAVFLLGLPVAVVGDAQHPLQAPLSTSSSSLIDLHKSLVDRPSITGSEGNVSAFLRDYLRGRGFTVETQPVVDDRENIFAYLNSSRRTRVLVTSHIDTVPPFWPYERRGDEIWGRGTVDAKGSVAAQIVAVESLLEAGTISEGDAALLFVVSEEKDGLGMRAANDLGLSWEAVIFGEPTELKLASGHKGGMGFTIRAKGKAGHSGYPESGRNAIDILVRSLSALGEVVLPWSEDYGNTTINVGKIEGGVAGNVIAEDAVATVSVRIASGTPEAIQDLIKTAIYASSSGVDIDFSRGLGPVPIDHDIEGKHLHAYFNYLRLRLTTFKDSKRLWSITGPTFRI